jgi:Polyketide cyclase / dehydrase and lipid transport
LDCFEATEDGRTRDLAASDGSTIIERLMAFDEKGRSYTYHMVQGPFPLTDYYSTLKVSEPNGGKGSRVDWSGEFNPNGVSEQKPSEIVRNIFDDGLKALAAKFPK